MNQDQVENYGRTAQGVVPETSRMKRTAWNPAEFAYWYQRADLSKRVRIWADMKASHRRLYFEFDMFRRFSRTAGIKYKPDSEVTLEPNSASSPPPDIACQGEERPLYFELGEVIAEGHAAGAAEAERERLHAYGGPVDLWRSLLRIFAKKLRKRYNTSATPIDLLLYYGVGRQACFWPFLAPGLRDRSPWIQRRWIVVHSLPYGSTTPMPMLCWPDLPRGRCHSSVELLGLHASLSESIGPPALRAACTNGRRIGPVTAGVKLAHGILSIVGILRSLKAPDRDLSGS